MRPRTDDSAHGDSLLGGACVSLWTGAGASGNGDSQEIKAISGEDVVLPCRGPRDSSITLIEWIRPDLKSDGYVFFYRNNRSYNNFQHPSFHGRVLLRDKSAVRHGDVSVLLKNISISDSGTYECQIIIRNKGSSEGSNTELRDHVRLKVTDSGGGAGHTEDGGDKDGNNSGHVGLAVGLSVVAAAVAVVVVGFVIFRKRGKKLNSNRCPTDEEDVEESL